MASQNAIATKTVNAVRTIQTASTALANKLNIEITPLPPVNKKYDPDYSRAVQLANLAGLLKDVAIATGAAKAADFDNEMAPIETVEEVVIEPPTAETVEEAESVAPKRKRKEWPAVKKF